MNKQWNILHIISDQHQAGILGCAGHPQVITPNLDRLAGEGVRFTNAYTQNPICTPSRLSIFSGQYCHNHGYYGLSGPRPVALPSFFSHFKAHGYRTAGIGCLHMPNNPRNWLETHLDLFLDYHESVDAKAWQTPFYDDLRQRGTMEKDDIYVFSKKPELAEEGMPSQAPYEDTSEAWSVRETVRFIDECGDRPFCVQVSLQRPHAPFYPSLRFWELYPENLDLPPTINQSPAGRPPHFRRAWEQFHQRVGALETRTFEAMARRLWRGYLGCISFVDHAVGELLEFLSRTGKAANTVVIYHADHGGYSGTHGILEKAPGICSEAICKVPFIWRAPGNIQPGYVCAELVESIDLAPTIAALCGLPPMETTDGRDLTPLLRGESGPVKQVVVTENPWSKALRWKHWRFVHYQQEMFGGDDVGELYDLNHDPEETCNLYHDPHYRETVDRCRRLLLEWLISTARVVTAWPPPVLPADSLMADLHYDYRTVVDGKESNQAGPRLRLDRGQVNYL